MTTIDLSVAGGDWPEESNLLALVGPAVEATMAQIGQPSAQSELSLLFSDDTGIHELNRRWRNKDKPTNVLSFPATSIDPGSSPGPLLGDIVLAFETVNREATLENKPFDHHVIHLVVHGLLHLLGYDHEVDTDALIMEKLEKDILASLGINDPYRVVDD